MLYVVFTQLEHNKIKKFEKIPFPDAVALSKDIEMECRELKKKIPSEFRLLGENNEELYRGYPVFGSYNAPNLYIHIRKNLPAIKTNKEKEKKRLALMAEMDELVPEEFKQEEEIERDKFKNIDPSKVSHLKRWQRRTVYGVGLFFVVACIAVSSFFFIQIVSFDNEFNKVKAESEKKEDIINHYEKALLGNNKELKNYYASHQDKLGDREKQIYAKYLMDEKEYSKLVALYDNNPKLAAIYISSKNNIDALKEFNKEFPTNEAKFDIAFAEGKYNEVLAIENVEITTERSKKKTYSFLKTGKVDEAKKELENNNDKKLAEKIKSYEDLKVKLDKINQDIKDNKKNKKKKKKLEKQKKDIENKISKI